MSMSLSERSRCTIEVSYEGEAEEEELDHDASTVSVVTNTMSKLFLVPATIWVLGGLHI